MLPSPQPLLQFPPTHSTGHLSDTDEAEDTWLWSCLMLRGHCHGPQRAGWQWVPCAPASRSPRVRGESTVAGVRAGAAWPVHPRSSPHSKQQTLRMLCCSFQGVLEIPHDKTFMPGASPGMLGQTQVWGLLSIAGEDPGVPRSCRLMILALNCWSHWVRVSGRSQTR